MVLKAAQVGPGYTLQEREDSHKLEGYVTLDLCGADFPSEALRTERLQVNYIHPPPAIQVSNEVVSYQSGGTQQALRELADVAALSRDANNGPGRWSASDDVPDHADY